MSTITNFSLRAAGTKLVPRVQRSWLRRALRSAWRGIREWCGDSAYETYLRSNHTQHPSNRKLSPNEFYVAQLERRYSRPNRCC